MDAPQNPDPSRGQSRRDRARQQGLSGLQASTMGLVMVGCITVGFLLGQWLDRQMGTSYWVPVLVVVGAIAGFREMFRTVTAINKQSSSLSPSADRFRDRDLEPRALNAQTQAGRAVENAEAPDSDTIYQDAEAGTPAIGLTTNEPVVTHPRPRIFQVPPPPQSSFAQQSEGSTKRDDSTNKIIAGTPGKPDADLLTNTGGIKSEPGQPAEIEADELSDDTDLIKRLLGDDPSAEDQSADDQPSLHGEK